MAIYKQSVPHADDAPQPPRSRLGSCGFGGSMIDCIHISLSSRNSSLTSFWFHRGNYRVRPRNLREPIIRGVNSHLTCKFDWSNTHCESSSQTAYGTLPNVVPDPVKHHHP